jgi:hypothetical protein
MDVQLMNRYRTISVNRIDLYSDGNYPMGIKITYLPYIGGKTKVVSYMCPQRDYVRQ